MSVWTTSCTYSTFTFVEHTKANSHQMQSWHGSNLLNLYHKSGVKYETCFVHTKGSVKCWYQELISDENIIFFPSFVSICSFWLKLVKLIKLGLKSFSLGMLRLLQN